MNFWRQALGAGPLAPEQVRALPRVRLLGRAATLVEAEGSFTDKEENTRPGAMLLGAMVFLDAHSVFVKMTGPADLVRPEREHFVEFCESIR